MHIVFIVGSYYPYYSAVGKCVGNIADELSKDYKVTIICQKTYLDQKDIEVFSNQLIRRVVTQEIETRIKFADKIKSTIGFQKSFLMLKYSLYKISRVLKILLSKTSLKKELVFEYTTELKKINEPIDFIIPVCMPFESVEAAYEYKINYNKKSKIIPYIFDYFVESNTLHRNKLNKYLKRKNHILIENKIIENSESVLIVKHLQNYYNNQFQKYWKKIYIVEHPLLKKPKNTGIEYTDEINFIYAGSFYRIIRKPDYMLSIFDIVLDRVDGKLNLYSFGNCNNIINKYASKNKKILRYQSVSSDEVNEIINKNNFLVAVGNKTNKQVPSKVFEYLSYGKPIIYFYSNNQDSNLNILKKYDLAICLKQDHSCFESNLNELIKFCNTNMNKRIEFEEVSKIFNDALPSYTVKIIKDIIEK